MADVNHPARFWQTLASAGAAGMDWLRGWPEGAEREWKSEIIAFTNEYLNAV